MSKLEQLPADAVELLRQVCYTGISLDSHRVFNSELTAQAGTVERFCARTAGIVPSSTARNHGLISVARNFQS